MCPFYYTAVAGIGKVVPVNRLTTPVGVAVVTPSDRPKSVRNRCVIELFVALFVLLLCPFDISAGVGAFVIGLSQISSLFSWYWSICLGNIKNSWFPIDKRITFWQNLQNAVVWRKQNFMSLCGKFKKKEKIQVLRFHIQSIHEIIYS